MSLRSSQPSWLLTAQLASSLAAGLAGASEVELSDDRPLRTRPGDFSPLVEPGVALPLTSPQSELYVAWNEAMLQDSSRSVLDEVVRAMRDNRGFRVQVEGHASPESTNDHNQTISEQRADAVLNYLVSHGIDRDRLASKGLGASAPSDTNDTVAGRENNRRVEPVVYFLILDTESS